MFYRLTSLLFIIALNFSELLLYLEHLRKGISLWLVDFFLIKKKKAEQCTANQLQQA